MNSGKEIYVHWAKVILIGLCAEVIVIALFSLMQWMKLI